ncbi:MAG TPA: FecR domain-containing protein [Bacteroidales bacterium]|nr:FecR domain-containing protein [Bacteroidales bacterium]
MKPDDTYYNDLISRYYFGEASPEEIRELELWVKADPSHEELFSGYAKTWKALAGDRIEAHTDLDREWDRLKARISTLPETREARTSVTSLLVFRPVLRVAAAILLLLIPAWFLFRYMSHPADKVLTAGREMVECTLPDGSSVTLDAGSTLTFPTHFTGAFRKVSLRGQAWFEVVHDRSHPFLLSAGNTRIRVVGTTFSVNAIPGKSTQEVVLATGMVSVFYSDDPAHGAYMQPGDRAGISTRNPAIRVTKNDDVNFLAWKTRHILFDATSLEEATSLLTRVYHVPVTLASAELKSYRITATFEGQTLESVLNVLAATLDLRITGTAAGYELSGMAPRP